MCHGDEARRARIRDAILRYACKHPHAADTTKGIVARWLPHAGFEDAANHIDAVLEDMVSKRLLQSRKLPDGETLYAPGDSPDRGRAYMRSRKKDKE